jgi:predicted MFS family arabinose efflux permease
MTEAAAALGEVDAAPLPVQREGAYSRTYSGYIVFMFAMVALLGMADRYSLSILLEPIKRDLQVSDTTMGMLSGAAFSIVFAIAGIPIARLADGGNRRNLLAIATAVWSAATALSGAVANIAHLFVARMGVAVAESAIQPSVISMIGDLFAPARRGLVIALFMMGGALGLVLGSVVAGLVAEAYGWRMVFVVLGLPGILFAAIFYLTVPEPMRGAKETNPGGHQDIASTGATIRYLLSVPTAWRLIFASVLLLATQGAWGAWMPTFFLRVHGMSMAAMSASFGLFMGIGAVLSMVLSGFASDWLARRGERWRIRFIAATLLLGIPFVIGVLMVDNVWLAWGLVVAFQVITAGAPPVIAAAGVGVVRPRTRAMWTSLYNLAGVALGGLLGPLLVGYMSDRLVHTFGNASLRYGLLVIPVLLLPSALVYIWASMSADRDAARARSPVRPEVTP